MINNNNNNNNHQLDRNQSSLISLHPHPQPLIQKTALFACFHFLIFHPFFQGVMTPFAPMCGRPWPQSVTVFPYRQVGGYYLDEGGIRKKKKLERPAFKAVVSFVSYDIVVLLPTRTQ